jgi:hypothetical protein
MISPELLAVAFLNCLVIAPELLEFVHAYTSLVSVPELPRAAVLNCSV